MAEVSSIVYKAIVLYMYLYAVSFKQLNNKLLYWKELYMTQTNILTKFGYLFFSTVSCQDVRLYVLKLHAKQ